MPRTAWTRSQIMSLYLNLRDPALTLPPCMKSSVSRPFPLRFPDLFYFFFPRRPEPAGAEAADCHHRPSLAGGSTARWVNVRTTTRSRSGGPIPAPSLYCVFRTFTHTPHHTGWHTRRRFGLLSEAYWFVRALGPISGCRGSHGGSGGDRSERYPRADRNLAPTPFAGSGRCR